MARLVLKRKVSLNRAYLLIHSRGKGERKAEESLPHCPHIDIMAHKFSIGRQL